MQCLLHVGWKQITNHLNCRRICHPVRGGVVLSNYTLLSVIFMTLFGIQDFTLLTTHLSKFQDEWETLPCFRAVEERELGRREHVGSRHFLRYLSFRRENMQKPSFKQILFLLYWDLTSWGCFYTDYINSLIWVYPYDVSTLMGSDKYTPV